MVSEIRSHDNVACMFKCNVLIQHTNDVEVASKPHPKMLQMPAKLMLHHGKSLATLVDLVAMLLILRLISHFTLYPIGYKMNLMGEFCFPSYYLVLAWHQIESAILK